MTETRGRRRHFKAEQLPEVVRAEIERLLEAGHTYDEIHAHLQGLGAQISRAALGRWGKHWLAKREDLDTMRAIAREYAEGQGAEPLALEEVAAALALDLICRCLLTFHDIQADELTIHDVTSLVGAIGRLQSSGVAREKWQLEVASRAKAAADEVEKTARKGGLSDALVNDIRRKILGIGEGTP